MKPRDVIRAPEADGWRELRSRREVRVLRFYPAIISKHEDTDCGVVFPDFPGCMTTAETIRKAAEMAFEALALHVEGMVEDKEALPEPSAPDAPLPDWLADLPDHTVARLLIPVVAAALENLEPALARTLPSMRKGRPVSADPG